MWSVPLWWTQIGRPLRANPVAMNTSFDDPMTRDEFEQQLQQLVLTADGVGVSVPGAYDIRSPDPDVPDLQVEITRIA